MPRTLLELLLCIVSTALARLRRNERCQSVAATKRDALDWRFEEPRVSVPSQRPRQNATQIPSHPRDTSRRNRNRPTPNPEPANETEPNATLRDMKQYAAAQADATLRDAFRLNATKCCTVHIPSERIGSQLYFCALPIFTPLCGRGVAFADFPGWPQQPPRNDLGRHLDAAASAARRRQPRIG